MSTRRFLTIFLNAAAVVLLAIGCSQQAPAAEAVPTPEVVAQTARSGEIAAAGQVVPLRSVSLAFQTGGTVAEVLVSEGQNVAAGEALARLDSSVLDSALAQAQAGLDAANAGLTAAEAQLALAQSQRQSAAAVELAARAQLALAQAGARPEQVAAAERSLAAAEAGVNQAAAERSQMLDVSDAAIRAAEAQLAAAESQYTALQETYDTIVTTCFDLPDGGEVCPLLGPPEENTRAQLDAARSRYEAAQLALEEAQTGATAGEQQLAGSAVTVAAAQRDLAQAQLDLVNAGARDEEIRQAEIAVDQAALGIAQADNAVAQAETGVSQAQAAVLSAEAGLRSAQVALERLTLVAPFDGTVGDMLVEVGELVAPGVPVATVADLGRWLVETNDLVELDVVMLDEGQSVEVTVDALPGEILRGVITDIGRTPELARGDVTYRVRVELDPYPDLPIRWGMSAEVLASAN